MAYLSPGTIATAKALCFNQRVVAAFVGNLLRLRRVSDNAEQDWPVGFGANGDHIDYAAVAVWTAGADPAIVTRYDQTGQGKHQTEDTAANQPFLDLEYAFNGCHPAYFGATPIDGEAQPRHYLSITNLAYTKDNIAVWHVMQTKDVNTQIFWNLFQGGTPESGHTLLINCSVDRDVVGLRYYRAGINVSTNTGVIPRSMPSVLGTDLSQTALRSTLLEQTADHDGQPAWDVGAGDGFTEGFAGQFGSGWEGRFHSFGVALFTSGNLAAQTTRRQELEAVFGIQTVFDSRIVGNGNSNMENWKVAKLRSIIFQLQQLGLPGNPEFFNLGISGRTQETERTTFAALASSLFTAAYGPDRIWYISEAGTNDIHFGASLDDLKTTTTTFHGALHTAGFKVLRPTLLPYGDRPITDPAQRDNGFNQWVEDGLSGADEIVLLADVLVDLYPANSSPKFYDGIHLTRAGTLYVAEEGYKPVLDALLASVSEGTLAVTLDAVSVVAQGRSKVEAQMLVSLDTVTGAAAAEAPITGMTTGVLDAFTLAAEGSAAITGMGAVTLEPITLAAVGDGGDGSIVNGQVSITLAQITLASQATAETPLPAPEAYTVPTPADLRAKYPAFAGVSSPTIQTYINDTLPIVTTAWTDHDYRPAIMALAAHNMTLVGIGDHGEVAGYARQGLTSIRSGGFSASFSDKRVATASGNGYDATVYGAQFKVLAVRNRGGPRIVVPAVVDGGGRGFPVGAPARLTPWGY